jgi:hypothetical protein
MYVYKLSHAYIEPKCGILEDFYYLIDTPRLQPCCQRLFLITKDYKIKKINTLAGGC